MTTHDPKLQKGLNPANKEIRVKNYAENMSKEVAMISHSCGVPEPRLLRRYHARLVSANGISLGLNEIFPDRKMRSEYSDA